MEDAFDIKKMKDEHEFWEQKKMKDGKRRKEGNKR